MNYLFHIHSNVNLLTATLIVENENLDNEKVLFILSRGVETDFGVKKIVLPKEVYYHPFNTLKSLSNLKFIDNKKIISRIDTIINENSVDDFLYFCPNASVPLYRAFYSHPRCIAVNYIEDGLDAYLSKEELLKKYPSTVPWHIKIADFLFRLFPVFCASRLNYVIDGFLPDLKGGKSGIYCLNEKSYLNQDNPKRTLLKIKDDSYYNYTDKVFNNVFVFDAVKNQNVIKEEDFFDFVKWFCEDFFNLNKIAIKFHPFQDEKEIERILSIFIEYAIDVEVIKGQVALEAVFIKKNNLNVFGIGSSLLVYAALFGVKNVYVLYPYFKIKLNYISPRLTIWNDIFQQRKDVNLWNKDFMHKQSIEL